MSTDVAAVRGFPSRLPTYLDTRNLFPVPPSLVLPNCTIYVSHVDGGLHRVPVLTLRLPLTRHLLNDPNPMEGRHRDKGLEGYMVLETDL